MGTTNPICVPDGLVSPLGLDPREEFEVSYLVESVSKDAPGVPYALPDVPLEALLAYLTQFEEDVSKPTTVVKGFIDAEVLGTHTAMRGIAETLRRDLIAAADLYDKSGKKITKEVRAAVEAAQAYTRSSLSKVRMQTRSMRLLSESGVSLQFGAVTQPWAKDLSGKIRKSPLQIYSSKDLFKNPTLASNKQVRFRNTQEVLVLPKKMSAVLNKFDNVLLAVEIAPSVHKLYNAVNEGDLDKGLRSIVDASAVIGAKVAGDMVTRIGFSICVEVGLAATVAMPVVGLPITLACGVGAVIGGIYVGEIVKSLPTQLTPVENLKLVTP